MHKTATRQQDGDFMSLIDEDEALIAAALKGSAYAWEKLVKRYESKIYNHGLRLTGNSDRKSVV